MARKVIDIIYNLVRKRMTLKGDGTGITSLPRSDQVERGMKNVFKRLKEGGYNVVSAEKVIKSEDDLARVLEEINQKQIAEAAARKKAAEGIERIFDKMRRNIPLNPDDQAALQGSGFKTALDNFKGFEPKVIPGGKKPRDKKLKGGVVTAIKKLKKKFGKDIIQKGKAPKRSKKKEVQDMFREFNRKNKAGGGVAHMLGEPREEMAAGGMALRRLLQFLNKGTGKTGSEGLRTMKLDPQIKFFAEKQGFNPDQARIDYLEQVLNALRADRKMMRGLEPGAPSEVTGKAKDEMELMADKMFKENFLKTTQGGRFEGLSTEAIDQSIMELETILKNLKTKGQGRKLNADGGRIGLKDGGMSRRTFLKIMAALAAFPVVGKLAKTTKVAKNVAPIVTPTSEMPAHFPKLVEKIIREGQVVKKDYIKKTGDVTTYRHPDRPDIELTIEGEGNRIQLDFETDQGMKGGYEFKKGVPDETASKPPDDFEAGEVKYRFSQDGESYSKDFELGIDTGTENLDEFVGMGKQKTSKSKVNLPESDDYADGGLAGLLGE
tara:strand:+ start:35 stop:1681 length:1647 start_codon:yes stop_codon:yes gene_type:complete